MEDLRNPFILRTAFQTTKYTKHTKTEPLTMQRVFTRRVNATALLSACHLVCFVYFVVSTAGFRVNAFLGDCISVYPCPSVVSSFQLPVLGSIKGSA